MDGCASRKLGHIALSLLRAANNASTQFASHEDAIAANEYPLKNRLCAPVFLWVKLLTNWEHLDTKCLASFTLLSQQHANNWKALHSMCVAAELHAHRVRITKKQCESPC